MNFQNGKITQKQLMILIAGFIQGSVLLVSIMDGFAEQNTWLAIVFSFLACVPFAVVYAYLGKRFGSYDFVGMNDIIYGPWVGKAITVLYITYFFYLLALNTTDIGDFYTEYIMTDTPGVVFSIMFILVSAYCLKKGIENLARVSVFSVLITFLVVGTTFLLLLGKMDFSNFLPILRTDPQRLWQGIHIFATFPFGEVVVFLTVMPALSNNKHVIKYTFFGLGLAALTLVIISVRNTAVLGSAAGFYNESSYQAVRLIDIWGILNRVELLVAISFTISLFTKVTVLYYATTATISKLLKMRSMTTLLLPIGSAAIVVGMSIFSSSVEHQDQDRSVHAFYMMVFEVVFPIASLIIAWIRKLPKGGKNKQCSSSS